MVKEYIDEQEGEQIADETTLRNYITLTRRYWGRPSMSRYAGVVTRWLGLALLPVLYYFLIKPYQVEIHLIRDRLGSLVAGFMINEVGEIGNLWITQEPTCRFAATRSAYRYLSTLVKGYNRRLYATVVPSTALERAIRANGFILAAGEDKFVNTIPLGVLTFSWISDSTHAWPKLIRKQTIQKYCRELV